MSKGKSLETRIKKAASNGIITCAALRKIAEEISASYSEAGKAATAAALLVPAVYNAIGKWVEGFPITRERVLKALGRV